MLPQLQNRGLYRVVPENPVFYLAKDIKRVGGAEMNKTMFTRMAGAVFSLGGCYAVYNTRASAMKWSGMGEFKALHSLMAIGRMNAGVLEVDSAVLFGESGDVALRTLLASEESKRLEFRFDGIYRHIYFIAMNEPGVRQLKLLMLPDWKRKMQEALFDEESLAFDKGIFEKNAATKACERYLSIYQPLYQQYFTRFFGAEKAERYAEEAVTGGYGSYTCITEFINGRSEYLPVMLEWVDEFYKTHTVYNSKTAAKKKTIKNLSVTAKKGTEVIKIKTIKKAKVVVTVSQKIIKSGKKAVKKLVIKPAKNKNGTVSVKLSKKLKKGIKVTAKVTKEGYKAKTKTITIK